MSPRKPDRTQLALDELHALRGADPGTPEGLTALTAALAHKSHLVVAAAAAIAGEFSLESLGDALERAFPRFLQNPIRADPQCRAKIALAQAMYQLDHDPDEAFRLGVRHIQREPVFGGTEDTAPELRAICAMALATGPDPDALLDVAELLADPEPVARRGAAQALGASGRVDAASPLLRYKLLIGDDDLYVISACAGSLLSLAPERELGHVSGLLTAEHAPTREAAALALGESRLEAAFTPLVAFVEAAALAPERRVGLVALAVLRTDESWGYLLGLLAKAPEALAADAAGALSNFRYDADLCRRVEQAAGARSEARVREAIAVFA
ncbi:HEAT repeat domain-containing protein [Haliangium sp.]|uniref:HEAT repeat domain-containing protein n=1 Tax=Haliangium sp. TaxID=2663208 RepID=UPI003D0E1875